MRTLLLLLGSVAIIAACAVSIWCAVDMRRNVLLVQETSAAMSAQLQVVQAMTVEMSKELDLHRAANERSRAVMESLRGRAIQYRDLHQWFNAWGMLDGMATLALEYQDDHFVAAKFREQFDLTLRAAQEARKADGDEPVDHGHDRQSGAAEGDRGGA